MACFGSAWPVLAWPGVVWLGVPRFGLIWLGFARLGSAWCGLVRVCGRRDCGHRATELVSWIRGSALLMRQCQLRGQCRGGGRR